MSDDTRAIMKAQVGERTLGPNDEATPRIGRHADLIVAPWGKYYQAAKDGRIHHYASPDEGIAPGTDVGATTAPFAFVNPSGNDKDLVILHARLVYESGTLGAGPVYWVRAPNITDTAPTGTAMLYAGGRVEGSGDPTGFRMIYTATIGATDPVIFRMFGSLDAELATTAAGMQLLVDEVDGSIIVAPGYWVAIMADAAAGTTPLIGFSITIAAVPV